MFALIALFWVASGVVALGGVLVYTLAYGWDECCDLTSSTEPDIEGFQGGMFSSGGQEPNPSSLEVAVSRRSNAPGWASPRPGYGTAASLHNRL